MLWQRMHSFVTAIRACVQVEAALCAAVELACNERAGSHLVSLRIGVTRPHTTKAWFYWLVAPSIRSCCNTSRARDCRVRNEAFNWRAAECSNCQQAQ
eukprot:2617-Heterococcus_DN1.PRE.2